MAEVSGHEIWNSTTFGFASENKIGRRIGEDRRNGTGANHSAFSLLTQAKGIDV
jgi:hypothetical protein